MPTYEKSPCEKCGKQITTFPAARARHMNVCGKPEGETAKVKEPEVKREPMAAVQPRDPLIAERIKTALAAQERFKKAPQVFVADQSSDEMLELRKIYCQESLGPNPSKSVYFGITKDMDRDVARGYVPIIDSANGDPVHLQELTMYWRPIEIAKAIERDNQIRGEAPLKKAMKQAVFEHPRGNGGDVSAAGLSVEEFSAEKVTITKTGEG